MRFRSALSTSESTSEAAREVVEGVTDGGDAGADVAFVFFTAHHLEDAGELLEQVADALQPLALVGCSAEGVIGQGREIERRSGVSLLCGSMPEARMQSFTLGGSDWQDLLVDDEMLREAVGYGSETRGMILLGDPYSTPLPQLLASLERACPGMPVSGGMASAASREGENVLMAGETLPAGGVAFDTIVSQGCRPVGRTFLITKAHDNVIEQLGGRPALQVLRETVHGMPVDEATLLEQGLFIGRAVNEYQESFGRGDFVVRNVIGGDEKSGAIAVTDYVRVGQTVQFQARDASSADEDLAQLLEAQRAKPPAAGGLLFTCNGRGTRMFETPGHDAAAAQQAMPETPVAGFFAAGEIGPVAGRNWVHGYTASFALFRPK
jgi:small ligand-binding sensory domain FIST